MVPKIRSKNRHKSPPLHSNRPPHPISPINRLKLGLSTIIGSKLVVPTRGELVQLLMIMNISLIARTLRGRAACSSDLLCFRSTSSSYGLWTEGLRARGSLTGLYFCILCCRGCPFCGSQLRVRWPAVLGNSPFGPLKIACWESCDDIWWYFGAQVCKPNVINWHWPSSCLLIFRFWDASSARSCWVSHRFWPKEIAGPTNAPLSCWLRPPCRTSECSSRNAIEAGRALHRDCGRSSILMILSFLWRWRSSLGWVLKQE